jgi:ABC-type phosphate transport system auxiliary subunit
VWNGIILCDQEQEMELKKRLQELERFSREKEHELTRQLDEATVAASQEALERTRLANDKLHLERELRRHEAREAELVRERKDRENSLLVAQEQLEKEVYPNCCVENLRSLSLPICLSSLYDSFIYIEMLYCGL